MGKSMTELQRYLEALLDKKDMYWQIRLKANRLTCGDRNAVFSLLGKPEKFRNVIISLEDGAGGSS